MSQTDLTGQKIEGVRLQKQLVRRPVSTLYEGLDTEQGHLVFVEVLNATRDADAELAGRFLRRMETVSKLSHSHIAPVLHVSKTAEGRPFAVIQHAVGATMAEWLATTWQPDERTAVLTALQLVHDLATALSAAHPAGIFHHDLRPANVIMHHNATPYLIDLGVPIDANANVSPFDPNNPPRTLDYRSPEQLEGKPLSGRSNVYSLGIILYELLAGHRPELPHSDWDIFERHQLPRETPLEQTRLGLAPETYAVVKNCLWRQDWNRFDTVADLAAALDIAIEAERRRIDREKETAVTDKQPYWLIAIGVILLLLLVVGGYLIWG